MPFADADLIARVLLHEDHHAFGELVRRYQSPVRAFLVRMTRGDSHLADDLAQETFLKAWQKLGTFRGGKLSTWLFGIAYNELRMAARRRKEIALDDAIDTPPETVAPAAASHLRLDMTEALKLLSAAERAAIILNCQNGLTHEETAQVLDCPLGTVKTNILRGKERLRRHLSAYENYESA